MPSFLDYSMKGRTYRYMKEKPQFCFGHGLSYTTFSYGDAQLVPALYTADGNMTKEKINVHTGCMMALSGRYNILYGGSSDDSCLKTLEVTRP